MILTEVVSLRKFGPVALAKAFSYQVLSRLLHYWNESCDTWRAIEVAIGYFFIA